MGGSDFLFALDQNLDPDGRPPVEGAQRPEMHYDARLVIARTPPVETAVAQGWLKRGGVPFVGGPRRLHVVMCVQQHGRGSGRRSQFTVNGGVGSRYLQQPHLLEPGCRKQFGGVLG